MRTIIPKRATLVPKHATCVFKGQIFDTYQWEEEMFDGSKGIFEMLKRPDSVEVLVVQDNKLLVQKQEQPFRGSFYSFPGGRHDHEEEDELEACQRELKEETGFMCAQWRLVEAIQRHQLIEAFLYTFVATTVTGQVAQQLDPGEKIENVWMSLPEIMELVPSGIFRSRAYTLFAHLSQADEIVTLPEYTG